jgi:hypothetical protein
MREFPGFAVGRDLFFGDIYMTILFEDRFVGAKNLPQLHGNGAGRPNAGKTLEVLKGMEKNYFQVWWW